MNILSEQKEDSDDINDVIIAAFKDHPHSNQKEHLLVSGLRRNHSIAVSLVAALNDRIVGYIAFSRVSIGGQDLSWYGLAPVAVDPEYQNHGIGSKLIIDGLEAIKNIGANGCVLLGEPEYYNRFGFKQLKSLTLANVPAEYFLALPFQNNAPTGRVHYDDAFANNG